MASPPAQVALLATLAVAVQLRIHELQEMPERVRERWLRLWAAEAVDPLASRGDVLQYGGGKRGEAAAVFNHLARGLAALAHCPGGVTFAGRHWCVDHDVCTGTTPAPRSAPPPTRRLVATIEPLEAVL